MLGLSPMEVLIIGVVAILLFGQKLPEVMKTVGKGYRDFRSGLSELQSQVNIDTYTSSSSYSTPKRPPVKTYDDYDEPTAPKFEPPPSDPSTPNPHDASKSA